MCKFLSTLITYCSYNDESLIILLWFTSYNINNDHLNLHIIYAKSFMEYISEIYMTAKQN